ncbi:hypothetical protein Dimus_009086 [Dionaea muscipula]
MTINNKRILIGDVIEREAMANCLRLLSVQQQQHSSDSSLVTASTPTTTTSSSSSGRLFTCKICRRRFSSFQALGGHSASHKQRHPGHDHDHDHELPHYKLNKTHQCSICGLQFPMGQALGGHMRRHKSSPCQALADNKNQNDHPPANSAKELAAEAAGSKPLIRRAPSPPPTPPPAPPRPRRPRPGDDLDQGHEKFFKKLKTSTLDDRGLNLSLNLLISPSLITANYNHDHAKSSVENDDLLELRLGPPGI